MLALRSLLVLAAPVLTGALAGLLAGCELVASFDRDKIPLPGTGVPSIPDDMDAGRHDGGWMPPPDDGGADGGLDAGADSGVTDAGADGGADAGSDAGADAGQDAGADAGGDAGSDAGAADAGADAGDAG